MLWQVFHEKSDHVLHIKKTYCIQNGVHVERQQIILKIHPFYTFTLFPYSTNTKRIPNVAWLGNNTLFYYWNHSNDEIQCFPFIWTYY